MSKQDVKYIFMRSTDELKILPLNCPVVQLLSYSLCIVSITV